MIPRGIFSLTSGGGSQAVETAALNNSDVIGISVGMPWEVIQETEGAALKPVFFDSEIPRIRQAGKRSLARVSTGSAGGKIPTWAFEGVQMFTYTSDQHDSVTFPVFWDETYLQRKISLYKKEGVYLNDRVDVIGISLWNANTDDFNVPDDAASITKWKSIGYTHEKMMTAGTRLLDAMATAAPLPYIYIATGSVDGALDQQSLTNDLVAYARGKYRRRIVFGRNSVSNKIAVSPGTTSLAYLAQRQPMAGQMLWFTYQDTTYRNNGGKAAPAATVLINSVEKFATYVDSNGRPPCWCEVYERDVVGLPAAINQVATTLQ